MDTTVGAGCLSSFPITGIVSAHRCVRGNNIQVDVRKVPGRKQLGNVDMQQQEPNSSSSQGRVEEESWRG